MNERKKILAISGSTRNNSANHNIIAAIAKLYSDRLEFESLNTLSQLPYFNPDIDNENVPAVVASFRNKIASADGILICTPEYVFSLPGILKNALEWTVSTTIFLKKPAALITASALGNTAHESLLLIMKTIGAKFDDSTTLLIQGARSKIDSDGKFRDKETLSLIDNLMLSFSNILDME
ncbi:MAG: NAD(P)H-dependent oxidoreductase [Bacteroidota bacterium]|nr:NAD(P)H-dependent oxidoreductase [Bacteroidota bacterium]